MAFKYIYCNILYILQVNRVKHVTNRYYNETSPVDCLHQDNSFFYFMFYETLCLNNANVAF